MRKAISDNLRDARKRNGLRQTEVAEKLGVDINRFRKWEQGANMPAIEIFVSLADIYRVSLDWVCGRTAEVGELSQDEQVMILNYRKASPQGKLDIMTASAIASQDGY